MFLSLDFPRDGEVLEPSGIQAKLGLDADPFVLAQGRGEHGRTTTKTFGGDEFGSLRVFYRYPQQAVGGSPLF
jgi:hypothetical protein